LFLSRKTRFKAESFFDKNGLCVYILYKDIEVKNMGSVLVSEEKKETDGQKIARLKQELAEAQDDMTIVKKVLGIIMTNQNSSLSRKGAIGILFSRKLSELERQCLREKIRICSKKDPVKLVFAWDGIHAELKFRKKESDN